MEIAAIKVLRKYYIRRKARVSSRAHDAEGCAGLAPIPARREKKIRKKKKKKKEKVADLLTIEVV
jgi:hypothetical protein